MNIPENILIQRALKNHYQSVFISEKITNGMKTYFVVRVIQDPGKEEMYHYFTLLEVEVVDNNEQKALLLAFECFSNILINET